MDAILLDVPLGYLNTPEADGKTLQAWIDENGMQANPIAQALSERI